MSDNWVGPGWWMASDGKWYPPRTPKVDESAKDGEPTRWSRRTPDGQPVAGATPLTSSETRAEEVATRRERAARARPEPVSIKRVEEVDEIPALSEVSEVNEMASAVETGVVDSTMAPGETIDLREVVDLRESETAKVVAEARRSPLTMANTDVEPSATDTTTAASAPERTSAVRSVSTTAAAKIAQREQQAPQQTSGSARIGDAQTPGRPVAEESSTSAVVPAEQEVVPATEDVPLQHAVLPAVVEHDSPQRRRTGLVLLALATGLAVLSGVLGALWLRERGAAEDLRAELARVEAADGVADAGLTELNDEVRTLRLQNEQLETRLDEMSALALELPEGRVTEIAVPFTPIFADEERERFIAVGEQGEYVVWSEGADGPITDSGQLNGGPTGLFAATAKAWVATDAGTIDVVSLINGEGLPTVELGPVTFMAPEERAYWTFDAGTGEVVRLRKSDGGVTASVAVASPVVDLTIGAGSVWALGEDGRVYRINTADFTVQPIDAGADLISITAGPDALWTLSAADGSLRRVDPVSGEVLVTVPVGRDPIDATFAGSSVWVALRSGTSLIEVDTRTAAVVSRTSLPGTPTALHQGDSGVFVTLEGDVPLVRVASLVQPQDSSADAGDEADQADDAG